ncbi:GAF domain-containing protein [Desulfobacterales bacterium HSG2]|nr:GAF domain-containing protein [Desulfobacterales bacterium HSG2]
MKAATGEIPDAFARIMNAMKEKFGFGSGSLFLTEDRDTFGMAACHPDTGEAVTEPESFRTGEGMRGKAAERGEISLMPGRPDSAGENASSGSLLCAPLTDEGLCGVMNFHGPGEGFGLTDEVRVFLQAVARLTAVNVKNIRMLEDIREKNAELERLRVRPRAPGCDDARNVGLRGVPASEGEASGDRSAGADADRQESG